MTGAGLMPVLTGRRDAAHDPDRPLGHELSGNAALFKGDCKLVRNLPPTGDKQIEAAALRESVIPVRRRRARA